MSALRVRDLRVRAAAGATVLDGVDLDVDDGERVLVVGPSGSGKSTLLRLAAGLEVTGCTVTGSVRVGDREVLARDADDEEDPLDLGWLPQDPAAAVCLPVVGDDVGFGCENRCWPPERVEEAVTTALSTVAGLRWRDRDSGTLSSGQAQRAGLAAALAPDPRVLLLDEPTALLDPTALRRVRSALDRAAASGSAPAVLLVEHRLDEWADGAGLPDRVVVLEGGRVVADGPAARVWAEQGARLAATGAHLPWDVERRCASSCRPPRAVPAVPSDTTLPTGAPLLRTTGLAVGHPGPGRRRRATGRPVIADAGLAVRAREVVAVVGVNGSGKSTLLHTLAGVLPPLAGRVERPAGRPALVFADPALQFLGDTVGEELACDGAPPALVDATLRELGLAHVAGLSVHRLSGGEQRRLSLAAVLQGDRAVVLADEPTRSLDRAGVRWAVRALRAAAAAGRGVLLTSHDLRFVLEVADRVHVVHGGVLRGGGPTRQVLVSGLPQRAGLPLPAAVRELLAVAA